MEKSMEEATMLEKEYWSDEEKSKEFFIGYDKLFAGHGDYIYNKVSELAK